MSAELEALEHQWARIVELRDVEAAEALLAEDFVLSSAGGVGDRVTRDDWLANLAGMETRSLICDVLDCRILGDVGVVRARLTWEVSFGDRDLTGSYLVADVFRRNADAWQVVWRISTRLAES